MLFRSIGEFGNVFSDISIAELGDRFAVCNINDQDEDADFRIRYNDGTAVTGELNVDGATDPAYATANLLECIPISSTRWVYAWFDDRGNDITIRLVSGTGTLVTGQNDIDTNVGSPAHVAAAGLRNNRFAIAYFDNIDDDIKMAVYSTAGDTFTAILSPTTIDSAAGTNSRVSVAEVNSGASSRFVVAWWDKAAGDIKAAVYDDSGTEVTAPFVVDSNPDNTYFILDVVSANSLTGTSICDNTFIISHTNSSNTALFKQYLTNGSEWDGICDFENPSFSGQWRNVTYPDINESVRFNVTISDDSQVASWTFSWNLTGAWQNVSNATTSSAAVNATTVQTTDAPDGTNVCYRWYAADVYGKQSQTPTYCFEVGLNLGTLTARWITPTGNTNVLYNLLFNITTQVDCAGGNCGQLNASAYHSTPAFGSGKDGAITITSASTIINNYTYLTANANAQATTISVASTTAFSPGDEVMIIQMQNISGGGAGTYEFKTISSLSASQITFVQPLDNSYYSQSMNTTSASAAQVVRIPHYTNVTLQSGSSITAPAWNGYTGGIVAFRALRALTFYANSNINVSTKGYRGGGCSACGNNDWGQNGEGVTGLGTGGGVGNPPANFPAPDNEIGRAHV